MAPARSPLAPERFPDIPVVPGVRLAAGPAGLRYQGRSDVLLAELCEGTSVAGLLTRSTLIGHPVAWCRRILPRGQARGLIVNAGNANVLNGEAGEAAVREEAGAAAALLDVAPEDVYIASTGVIGEPLDAQRITRILPQLREELSPAGWRAAADAIRTTDTFAKGSFSRAEIAGVPVTIAGIAKGSGMIQPDMATMLAFLFTDARIPPPALHTLLQGANERSFNAITVDSDTSTSDTVLLFATGQADHPPVTDAMAPGLAPFRAALLEVMGDLARQVVRDGEGARKLIEVRVQGAADDGSARRIAFGIANSPLVKTAIAGEDVNWGRVVMAIGKTREPVEPARLAISFGGHRLARNGARVPDLDEGPVARHLAGQEILIEVAVGAGPGKATVWTCDLTHDYVSINASYRS
jgi:glutamate N-acetyltransferase / amino-acid N-acetyltransferase